VSNDSDITDRVSSNCFWSEVLSGGSPDAVITSFHKHKYFTRWLSDAFWGLVKSFSASSDSRVPIKCFYYCCCRCYYYKSVTKHFQTETEVASLRITMNIIRRCYVVSVIVGPQCKCQTCLLICYYECIALLASNKILKIYQDVMKL